MVKDDVSVILLGLPKRTDTTGKPWGTDKEVETIATTPIAESTKLHESMAKSPMDTLQG